MAEIIKKDYDDNINFLIQQFKDKSKFVDLCKSINKQFTDLETCLLEIRDNFTLAAGVGVQLDIIGKIIGLKRNGRDNDSYRTLLSIKALINRAAGTYGILIETANALYDSTIVQVIPVYPAKVQLYSDGDIGIYFEYVLELDDGGLLILEGDEFTEFTNFNLELDDAFLMELDDSGILQVSEPSTVMLLQQPDDIAEELLFQVLPAGVDLILADDLILDDNSFLYINENEWIILT